MGVLIPLILIISIISYTPLKNATYRLIKFNSEFIPPTPFQLIDISQKMTALSGDTITIKFKGAGELPDSIPIYYKSRKKLETQLISQKDGIYSFTFIIQYII